MFFVVVVAREAGSDRPAVSAEPKKLFQLLHLQIVEESAPIAEESQAYLAIGKGAVVKVDTRDSVYADGDMVGGTLHRGSIPRAHRICLRFRGTGRTKRGPVDDRRIRPPVPEFSHQTEGD